MSKIWKSVILLTPWKLFFDGSACDDGQEIGVVLISPSGTILSSQTGWKKSARITKLSTKHFYLAWNS